LREHEAEFRAKGANLAAIGLGDRNYARMFREDTGIAFPLLVDEQRVAYRATELPNGSLLHLFRSDNAAARRRAKAGGHRQHKLGANPFQLGATFIFGPGNVDIYAHPSKTFGDNASPEEILRSIPEGGR
jgi:hypothetical protein